MPQWRPPTRCRGIRILVRLNPKNEYSSSPSTVGYEKIIILLHHRNHPPSWDQDIPHNSVKKAGSFRSKGNACPLVRKHCKNSPSTPAYQTHPASASSLASRKVLFPPSILPCPNARSKSSMRGSWCCRPFLCPFITTQTRNHFHTRQPVSVWSSILSSQEPNMKINSHISATMASTDNTFLYSKSFS